MKIRKFIATTTQEYLNEQKDVESNLNNNFSKWFGNSKVIQNNTPIIVYHGTSSNEDFDRFDKSKIGYNFHYSKGRNIGGFFFTDLKHKASNGIIKEVYLKLEKPLIIELKDWNESEVDYYTATDNFDIGSSNYFDIVDEKNYDGIIIKTPRGSLYVVLEPNQIKSIYNDGSWDINDDNINS